MSCFKGCSVQNPEAMKDNIKVRSYYYNTEQMNDDKMEGVGTLKVTEGL